MPVNCNSNTMAIMAAIEIKAKTQLTRKRITRLIKLPSNAVCHVKYFQVGRKLGAPVMEREKQVQLTMEYVNRKNDVIIPAMLSKLAIATPMRAIPAVRSNA